MEMAQICLMLFSLILALSVNFVPSVHGMRSMHEMRKINPEIKALLAFKERLQGPEIVFKTWDATLPNPCTWVHINCNKDNLVIAAGLMRLNLSGNLVPELGELPALERLNVGKNRITGTIPAELGNLMNLESLILSDNKLTGKVPSQISKLPKLENADLTNNGDLCWDFWPTPVFKGAYNLCQQT